jgi:branched-chain amino acid transport system ATP-binding protein
MPVLQTQGLAKDFRGFRALAGVDLRVEAGVIHAIIGPNGAGKTTLFNLLSGLLRPTEGHILFENREITGWPAHAIVHLGLARSFQITSIFPHLSLLDNIRLARQSGTPLGYYFWLPETALHRFDQDARMILESVGLAEAAMKPAHELSYGQKRALEIALTLALRPRMLLLDEPTAGLGVEDISRVVALIRQVARTRTVVLVEHNMGVVAALSDRITVLQRGRVLAEGTYHTLRKDPAVIEAYLGGAN